MKELDTLTTKLIEKHIDKIDKNDFESVILDAVSIGGADAINALKQSFSDSGVDLKSFDKSVAKIISKLLGVE